MGSVHADYQGHFSSQFVYLTNKIDGDEDYNYNYADDDDSSTNNDNNAPSPSHVASSAPPLLLVQPASPDTAPTKYQWQTGNPTSAYHNAPSVLLVQPPSPDTTYIKHSWLMDVDQDFNYENKDASSSSDIPYSIFFDQSHSQANCPNTGCQTAPKECYTRKYHSKLNSEC